MERFREYLAEPGNPHNIVVTGLRGVGKTVLLNHYSSEAEAAGWMVVEREFSDADAEPGRFAQTLLADLSQLTRRLSAAVRVGETARALTESVTEYLGTLGVTYGDVTVNIGRGRGPKAPVGRFDDDLREALARVSELCRRTRHPGIVLRYDEFHVVREKRGSLTLSALLAAVAGAQQRGAPVLLVLGGLPPLVENLAQAKSYSERMFEVEQLGNLRPPEDRAALVDPAARRERRFDEDAIDLVLEDTGGYPFFIQLYGDGLWRGSAGPVISSADFARLRPRILDGLDRGFFEARYARASPAERRVLAAISRHGERCRMEQLQVATGRRNNELQPVLSSLLNKGFVFRPTRGELAFTAPMFGAFVRRRGDD